MGCGPGFTSIYLHEIGYNVVALDIILDFLKFYDIIDLNPIGADMCYSPFKPKSFDAIISISALQWVFKEDNDNLNSIKLINLAKVMETILKPKASAIFQFYPKNDLIMKQIGEFFVKHTNLDGNFIIDNPNTPKKRRIFLLLNKI